MNTNKKLLKKTICLATLIWFIAAVSASVATAQDKKIIEPMTGESNGNASLVSAYNEKSDQTCVVNRPIMFKIGEGVGKNGKPMPIIIRIDCYLFYPGRQASKPSVVGLTLTEMSPIHINDIYLVDFRFKERIRENSNEKTNSVGYLKNATFIAVPRSMGRADVWRDLAFPFNKTPPDAHYHSVDAISVRPILLGTAVNIIRRERFQQVFSGQYLKRTNLLIWQVKMSCLWKYITEIMSFTSRKVPCTFFRLYRRLFPMNNEGVWEMVFSSRHMHPIGWRGPWIRRGRRHREDQSKRIGIWAYKKPVYLAFGRASVGRKDAAVTSVCREFEGVKGSIRPKDARPKARQTGFL